MAYLTLKSRVLDIFDYRNVDVSQFVPQFKPDEVRLEKDIARIRLSHGEKTDAQIVENGDLVIVSCRSDNKRYQKNMIPVAVGKWLFGKEFEQKLVGIHKDTETELTVGGEKVVVTVSKITHTILPTLDDKTVCSWGIEDVETVRDLKRYCISRQVSRFLDEREDADMASAVVFQQVAEKSVFEISPDEESYIEQTVRKRLSASSDDENNEISEMIEMMKGFLLNSLKIAVIGCAVAERENKLISDYDYNAVISEHLAYAQGGMTKEQAEEEYPVLEFMMNRYSEVYNKQIDAYVLECFNKKMNP